MRSRMNLPVFFGYGVICLLVAAFLVVQMSGSGLFQPTYRVNANLKSAADLVPGDDVTISGVRVGHLASLTPTGEGAIAALDIQQSYAPLYQDARVVVKSKNLLGERYLEIMRGSPTASAIPADGMIPQSHTLTPVEVSQVLDALTPDVRDQLTITINSLGEAVAGQGSNLNASAGDLRLLAQGLQGIATALANNQADLDSVIASLRKVMDTLAAWHTQFRELIANWDALMKELASREQQFQGTIVEQDRVLAILNQALGGGADASLHNALAKAPRLVDNGGQYLQEGGVVFPQVANETVDITRLFYELSSVMSYNDPNSGHHWRVYEVVNCNDLALFGPLPSPVNQPYCPSVNGPSTNSPVPTP